MTRCPFPVTCALAMLLGCGPLAAAPGDQPVKPLPPSAQVADDTARVRTHHAAGTRPVRRRPAQRKRSRDSSPS